MSRFKAGFIGTIIVLVLLVNMVSAVAPGPQVNTEVKLAGHATPIVISFVIAVKWVWSILSGPGGTGSGVMSKPSG